MDIQLKRGSSSARVNNSQIPRAGQLFVETDTGNLYAGNGGDPLKDLTPLYPANLYYKHQIIIRADGRSQLTPVIKAYPFVELVLQIDLPYDVGNLSFNFNGSLEPAQNRDLAVNYFESLQEGGQILEHKDRILGYNLNQLLHHSYSGNLEISFRSRLDGVAKVVLVPESRVSPSLGVNSKFVAYNSYPGASVNEVLYLDLGKGWLLKQQKESFLISDPSANMALTTLGTTDSENLAILQIEDSICY